MPDLQTLGLFAQYALGLYFIGHSISIKRAGNTTSFSYDIFKFTFGAALVLLALFQIVL